MGISVFKSSSILRHLPKQSTAVVRLASSLGALGIGVQIPAGRFEFGARGDTAAKSDWVWERSAPRRAVSSSQTQSDFAAVSGTAHFLIRSGHVKNLRDGSLPYLLAQSGRAKAVLGRCGEVGTMKNKNFARTALCQKVFAKNCSLGPTLKIFFLHFYRTRKRDGGGLLPNPEVGKETLSVPSSAAAAKIQVLLSLTLQ